MANRTSNRAIRRTLAQGSRARRIRIRITNRTVMYIHGSIHGGCVGPHIWAMRDKPDAAQNRAAKRSLAQMTGWE
jgi:aromatic ring-cleaving dioxygenase